MQRRGKFQNEVLDYYWGRIVLFFHVFVFNITHEPVDAVDKKKRVVTFGCYTCNRSFWVREDALKLVEKEKERQRKWKNNQQSQSK